MLRTLEVIYLHCRPRSYHMSISAFLEFGAAATVTEAVSSQPRRIGRRATLLQSPTPAAPWLEDDNVAGKRSRICLAPEIPEQPDYRRRLVAHGPKENDASRLSDHSHKGKVMVAGHYDASSFTARAQSTRSDDPTSGERRTIRVS